MSHTYTDDQLVEEPTKGKVPASPWPTPSMSGDAGLFVELGWQVALPSPYLGPLPCCAPSSLASPRMRGRWGEGVGGAPSEAGVTGETKDEVVVVTRLRWAFEKLNPTFAPRSIPASMLGILFDHGQTSASRLGFSTEIGVSGERSV